LELEMLKVKPGKKVLPRALRADLIAPCGMNCILCMCYLRDKNTCAGCRAGDEGKAKSCLACTIRQCEVPRSNTSGFCFGCDAFPCARLRRLDIRYRTKYRMSMLENLAFIQDSGIEAFIESERDRWICPECGGMQCVHADVCIYCGHEWG
jgi:hypothetical protein